MQPGGAIKRPAFFAQYGRRSGVGHKEEGEDMAGQRVYFFACALVLFISVNPSLVVRAAEATLARTDAKPRIVLLGTSAGPVARAGRSQPATALVIGDKTYLVDAGDNVSQQLTRAGLSGTDLEAIFITHLHFDHILGLGPLMAFSWMSAQDRTFPIYGPPGTQELVRRDQRALAIGVDIFKPQMPPRLALTTLFPVHEVPLSQPSMVYSDSVVKVMSVANSHYATAGLPPRFYGRDQSLSYRFEVAGKSIVMTGDTGPSPAVEALASDCDILVSEIVDLPSITAEMARVYGSADDPRIAGLRLHMEAEHLTPEEVGKLAQKARAKKLVVTHFAIGRGSNLSHIEQQIRQYYPAGEIVMGQDLMEIPLD
jgi:ribonuclease BN (tRNA processing enzyme)